MLPHEVDCIVNKACCCRRLSLLTTPIWQLTSGGCLLQIGCNVLASLFRFALDLLYKLFHSWQDCDDIAEVVCSICNVLVVSSSCRFVTIGILSSLRNEYFVSFSVVSQWRLKFGTKFQMEVPLFLVCPNFLVTVWDRWEEASLSKTTLILSAVLV